MKGNDDLSIGNHPTQGGGKNLDVSMGDATTMRPDGGAALGRVDRYALLEKLGQGGFGAVYRALDEEAGVEVALKALPPLISHSPEELDSVRRNFALVSKLVHSNIANVKHLHRVDSVDPDAQTALNISSGDYLVVMECVRGSTLSSWRHLFPDKKVPVVEALEIGRQIAAALDFAHGQKIIHRDIKPSNIMVAQNMEEVGGQKSEDGLPVSGFKSQVSSLSVKVLDFGLAAEIRSSMSRVSCEHGNSSGTRPYMAPEQWVGEKQGGFTDQYALAVLFYELVSGDVPFASAFQTGDAVVMLNVAQNQRPSSLPELDKKQNAALLRALTKKPEDRFGSCAEFIDALGGGKVIPRNPRKWFVGVLVVGLAVGALLSGVRWPVRPGPIVENPGHQVDPVEQVQTRKALEEEPAWMAARADASMQRSAAEVQRRKAEAVKADQLAREEWSNAVEADQRAVDAFNAEDYADASAHWKTAAEKFQRAEIDAQGATRVSAGRSAYIAELKRLKDSLSVDALSSYNSDTFAEAQALADVAKEQGRKKQWDAAVEKYKAAGQRLRDAFQEPRKMEPSKASSFWSPARSEATAAFSQLEAEVHALEREQLMEDAAALKAQKK